MTALRNLAAPLTKPGTAGRWPSSVDNVLVGAVGATLASLMSRRW